MVKIQDKKLGAINYFFQFLIVGYFLVFVMLVNKGYLEYVPSSGSLQISLTPYDAFTTFDAPYCLNDGTYDPNTNPRMCELWSRYKLLQPEDLTKSFFLTTGVKYKEEKRNCSGAYNDVVGYRACSQPWELVKTYDTYIGGIQSFEMKVTHSIAAQGMRDAANPTHFYGTSRDFYGQFLRDEGPVEIPAGQEDKYTIAELLQNLEGDDMNLDVDCDDRVCQNDELTYRERGIVLAITIEYYNDYEFFFSPGNIRYTVKVERVIDATHKLILLEDVNDEVALQTRTVRTQYGIRLDYNQVSRLGYLSFGTILMSAVSTLALLKIAVIVVDLTATRCLPQKKAYEKCKYKSVHANELVLKTVSKEAGKAVAIAVAAMEDGVPKEGNDDDNDSEQKLKWRFFMNKVKTEIREERKRELVALRAEIEAEVSQAKLGKIRLPNLVSPSHLGAFVPYSKSSEADKDEEKGV